MIKFKEGDKVQFIENNELVTGFVRDVKPSTVANSNYIYLSVVDEQGHFINYDNSDVFLLKNTGGKK